MTCAESRQQWSSYADAALASPERARLEAHLRGCAECRAALASLQQMMGELRSMPPPEAPDLRPAVRLALAQAPWWRELARRLTAPWPVSLPWHGLAVAATALLVVVVNRAEIVKQSETHTMMKQNRAETHLQLPQSSLNEMQAGRLSGMKEEKRASSAKDKFALRRDAVLDESNGRRQLNALTQPTVAGKFATVAGQFAAFEDADRAKTLAPVLAPMSNNGPLPSLQWRVRDVVAAAAELNAWVAERHGQALAMDARHFSITLPASAVPEFLRRFSSAERAGGAAGGFVDADSRRTFLLELVPSE